MNKKLLTNGIGLAGLSVFGLFFALIVFFIFPPLGMFLFVFDGIMFLAGILFIIVAFVQEEQPEPEKISKKECSFCGKSIKWYGGYQPFFSPLRKFCDNECYRKFKKISPKSKSVKIKSENSALEMLKKRFAAGKITKKEFLEKRKLLE